jgi:hypothetical protein
MAGGFEEGFRRDETFVKFKADRLARLAQPSLALMTEFSCDLTVRQYTENRDRKESARDEQQERAAGDFAGEDGGGELHAR